MSGTVSSPASSSGDTTTGASGGATPLAARGERLERSAALAGVPLALVPAIVLALVVHLLVGLVVGVAVLVAWVLVVRARILRADDRLLAPLGATTLGPGDEPRLENLVDGLCSTNGVAAPTLCLLDTPAANAAVAAVDERVTFVVTRGLLDSLDRMELEGVVANLVARARDGSAGYTTLVLSLLGNSKVAQRRLAVAYGDQRAVRSDLAAVELTRYPPGLRRALERMQASGSELSQAPGGSRLLWVAPAVRVTEGAPGADTSPAVQSNEQPLSLRAAVLSEL